MNGANSNTSGATTAKLRLKPAAAGSLIAKAIREELERDGYVLIEAVEQGNVTLSPTAPEDKTKIWWQTDINGVPQGSPKTYNTGTGKWEETAPDQGYTPPDERNGDFITPEGASSQSVEFLAMHGGAGYFVAITPILTPGVAAPAVMPTNFGYFQTAQSETGFTFQFFGIPVGGLTWKWQAREIFA